MAVTEIGPDEAEMGAPAVESLKKRQLSRLEAIATELSALYADLARTKRTEREQKATVYMNSDPRMSHGERQARASHETVSLDGEVLEITAKIDGLKEERDLIRLLVEWT